MWAAAAIVAALGACATGCGSDSGSAANGCAEFADGLARAWDRCMVQPYATGEPLVEKQCANGSFDSGKLSACLNDLKTADCSVVQSGAPPSCQNIETK